MVVKMNGKAYFHQLNSQDGAWEFTPAPDKYDDLPQEEASREVAPTSQVWVHRVEGREIVPEPAFWTLVPPWTESVTNLALASDGSPRLVPPPRTHFNSRKDTLVKSKGWRKLLERNRCVLFMDEFLEWSDEEMLPPGQKQVGRYGLANGKPMAVAAIWSPARIPGGEILTCSVVTCEPNELLRALPHHRMPALLEGEALHRWLDPTQSHPEELLRPTDSGRMCSRVEWVLKPRAVRGAETSPDIQQSLEL